MRPEIRNLLQQLKREVWYLNPQGWDDGPGPQLGLLAWRVDNSVTIQIKIAHGQVYLRLNQLPVPLSRWESFRIKWATRWALWRRKAREHQAVLRELEQQRQQQTEAAAPLLAQISR